MLDFANASGSIRHNLIHFAMEWYHFPPWLCKLIFCYYDKMFAFVVTKNWSTDFFALQIGLPRMLHVSNDIQCCFPNVARLPQPVLPEEKNWLRIKNAQITVVNPSFADDIILAASDATDCQQSINTMQEIVTWTKTMAFKPSKCRSWAGRFFRNATIGGTPG